MIDHRGIDGPLIALAASFPGEQFPLSASFPSTYSTLLLNITRIVEIKNQDWWFGLIVMVFPLSKDYVHTSVVV